MLRMRAANPTVSGLLKDYDLDELVDKAVELVRKNGPKHPLHFCRGPFADLVTHARPLMDQLEMRNHRRSRKRRRHRQMGTSNTPPWEGGNRTDWTLKQRH